MAADLVIRQVLLVAAAGVAGVAFAVAIIYARYWFEDRFF
jgi:uncharacterized protein involved in exopolysaccharide biosynthesis